MAIPSDPKIENFDVLQTSYKTIKDHGIRCDILVPKTRTHEGKRPVIVNFHGGGLVLIPIQVAKKTSDRVYPAKLIFLLGSWRLPPYVHLARLAL